MHISEGVLSAPVLLTGGAFTAAGVAVGLKTMDEKDIPKTAIIASTLFVASLIHLPLGPTSVHLMLNGIAGMILGWKIFPALLVSYFLQSILFQFGGLTALGVNVFNVALPGIIIYYIFGLFKNKENKLYIGVGSFIAGAGAVFLTALLVALSLNFTDQAFRETAKMAVISHLPVMIIEGIIGIFVVIFIKKVKPEIIKEGQDNEIKLK